MHCLQRSNGTIFTLYLRGVTKLKTDRVLEAFSLFFCAYTRSKAFFYESSMACNSKRASS